MDVMEDQLKSLSVDFAVFCLILQYHSEEKFQQTMKKCLNEKKICIDILQKCINK